MASGDGASGWIHGGDQPELPFSNSTTSRDAAESIDGSASKTMRERVMAYIRSQGRKGATDDEIEVALSMSHQTASARRRELALKIRIQATGERRPTRSGRAAQVWIAIDKENAQC